MWLTRVNPPHFNTGKTAAIKMSEVQETGRAVFANADVFKAARAGISREESTQVYENWASQYDEDMNEEKYHGAKQAALAMSDFFPTDRESKLVLDVGCGTGLVASQLQKQGFRRFHGLDPSEGMLELAGQKQLYDKLFCCYLDNNPLPMDTGVYDCVVSSGAMCEGHIPTSGLRQLTRVIKPGGAVCIVMREDFLQQVAEFRGKLEQEMADMETEGVWRLVTKKTFPNYFYNYSGVVFTFQVL